MVAPFRLVAGDHAPVQQTSTTCGSASLTVARMLANPAFAQWVRDGIRKDARDGDVPDDGTEAQRFAAYEQVVASRTNAAGRRGSPPAAAVAAGPRHAAVGRAERARVRRRRPGGRLRRRVVPPARPRRVSSTRMPPSAPGCVPAVPRCSTSATPGRRGTSCSSCRRRGSRSSTSTSRRSVASSTCRSTPSSSAGSPSPAGTCPWAAVWADRRAIRPRMTCDREVAHEGTDCSFDSRWGQPMWAGAAPSVASSSCRTCSATSVTTPPTAIMIAATR